MRQGSRPRPRGWSRAFRGEHIYAAFTFAGTGAAVRGPSRRNERDGSGRMRNVQWAYAALFVVAWLAGARTAGASYFSLEEAVRMAVVHAPAAVDARGSVVASHALGEGAKVSVFGNPTLEVTGEHGRYTTRDVNIISSLYLPVEVTGQRGA